MAAFGIGMARSALTRMPKSRLEFWRPKLEENSRRDQEKQAGLRSMGWDYLVVWECELRDLEDLARRIREFLG